MSAAVDTSGYVTTYTGGSWSTPSQIDRNHNLTSISCTSATFCEAVDNAGNALTYNGTTWSTPVNFDSTLALNAISCPTTSFCAAVDASGYAATYNGSVWSTPYDADVRHSTPSRQPTDALSGGDCEGASDFSGWSPSEWLSPRPPRVPAGPPPVTVSHNHKSVVQRYSVGQRQLVTHVTLS